jgi:hypothetical protein
MEVEEDPATYYPVSFCSRPKHPLFHWKLILLVASHIPLLLQWVEYPIQLLLGEFAQV